MYSYDRLNQLASEAEELASNFDLAQQRYGAVCDYVEGFVDAVPRNDNEARETFKLATELLPEVEHIRLEGRTTRALIALRRLEQTMKAKPASSISPLQHEERVLRSLIAWMSKPAVVQE